MRLHRCIALRSLLGLIVLVEGRGRGLNGSRGYLGIPILRVRARTRIRVRVWEWGEREI